MPIVAYSSLGRGLFSGKLKGNESYKAKEILDTVALKAYDCEENYERLRRCEILAEKKNATVAQIALRWIFGQQMDIYAVVSVKNKELMQENIDALSIKISKNEMQYLNLERNDYE